MRGRPKAVERLKDEFSHQSMIGGYLAKLGSESPEARDGLMADIYETFTTEQGLRVLMLFEKSTLLSGLPNGSTDSALREANAIRNFVLEIRRFVAHGR